MYGHDIWGKTWCGGFILYRVGIVVAIAIELEALKTKIYSYSFRVGSQVVSI